MAVLAFPLVFSFCPRFKYMFYVAVTMEVKNVAWRLGGWSWVSGRGGVPCTTLRGVEAQRYARRRRPAS